MIKLLLLGALGPQLVCLGRLGGETFRLVVVILVGAVLQLLRVRPLTLLPLLLVVFLELEVIKIKSLGFRRLFDVFDRPAGLILVVLLPKELRMLIPQADVVWVRVVLEEFRQFLWRARLLRAKNERFKAGGGLVLPFRYSVNDFLLFL
jgi:hypothetical protein